MLGMPFSNDNRKATMSKAVGAQGRARGTSKAAVKMTSHAIFQYNILMIDIDNTTLGLI